MELDEKDKMILTELQKDSNQPLKKIAKKIKIPLSTLHLRIQKLEKEGVIKKYSIVIDSKKVGQPITIFVLLSIIHYLPGETKSLSVRKIADEIKKIPEIQESFIVTGQWDIIVKITGESVEKIMGIVLNKIRKMKGVDKSVSFVSTYKTKETLDLVL